MFPNEPTSSRSFYQPHLVSNTQKRFAIALKTANARRLPESSHQSPKSSDGPLVSFGSSLSALGAQQSKGSSVLVPSAGWNDSGDLRLNGNKVQVAQNSLLMGGVQSSCPNKGEAVVQQPKGIAQASLQAPKNLANLDGSSFFIPEVRTSEFRDGVLPKKEGVVGQQPLLNALVFSPASKSHAIHAGGTVLASESNHVCFLKNGKEKEGLKDLRVVPKGSVGTASTVGSLSGIFLVPDICSPRTNLISSNSSDREAVVKRVPATICPRKGVLTGSGSDSMAVEIYLTLFTALDTRHYVVDNVRCGNEAVVENALPLVIVENDHRLSEWVGKRYLDFGKFLGVSFEGNEGRVVELL